jgi:hypothetical protein
MNPHVGHGLIFQPGGISGAGTGVIAAVSSDNSWPIQMIGRVLPATNCYPATTVRTRVPSAAHKLVRHAGRPRPYGDDHFSSTAPTDQIRTQGIAPGIRSQLLEFSSSKDTKKAGSCLPASLHQRPPMNFLPQPTHSPLQGQSAMFPPLSVSDKCYFPVLVNEAL